MIVEWLADLWKRIVHSVSMMTFIDFIDIFCVAVLLYYVYRFIRQRRAAVSRTASACRISDNKQCL